MILFNRAMLAAAFRRDITADLPREINFRDAAVALRTWFGVRHSQPESGSVEIGLGKWYKIELQPNSLYKSPTGAIWFKNLQSIKLSPRPRQ